MNNHRWIRVAAVILILYGLIEIGDSLALVLMQAGVIGNLYPPFTFAEIDRLISETPLLMLPVFLFFTVLHLWSGIGLWRDRLWAWWMALFVTAVVMIMVPFLLPISGGDALAAIVLIGCLFIGRFDDRPLKGE